MKKLQILTIFAFYLFTSCSSHENSESSDNNKNLQNSSYSRDGNNFDLNEFASTHVAISKSIVQLLDGSTLTFDNNSTNEILALTTENEIEQYFNDKGVVDAKTLITLLKDQQTNYNKLVQNMPDYVKLSTAEQQTLIEDALNYEMNNDSFWGNDESRGISCDAQYTIDVRRCNRNQTLGIAFSFIGGVLTGGIGGWIGAAASTTAFHFCMKDAVEDYQNCRR